MCVRCNPFSLISFPQACQGSEICDPLFSLHSKFCGTIVWLPITHMLIQGSKVLPDFNDFEAVSGLRKSFFFLEVCLKVFFVATAAWQLLALNWANVNCISAICSCVARFSFLKTCNRIRFSTEAERSSVGDHLVLFADFVRTFQQGRKIVDFLQ